MIPWKDRANKVGTFLFFEFLENLTNSRKKTKMTWISLIIHSLKSISVCSPPWYPSRIAKYIRSEFSQFVELNQEFLCASMYGSIGYDKKNSCMQQPYWRRFLTCKWKLSFFRRDQTENNMQLSHNILVLLLHICCCIPKELQLHCVLVLFLKDFHILTYMHEKISKRSWAIFGKNLTLNIFKLVRKTFKKDLHCVNNVYFKYITTLLRSKKNSNFCFQKN